MGRWGGKFKPHRILIIRPKISAKQRKKQFRHESPTGLHAILHYFYGCPYVAKFSPWIAL